jgi:hypothetical protein
VIRGARWARRGIRCQPACKPGSGRPGDRSPDVTAIPLGRASLRASSNQPGRLDRKTGPSPLRASAVPIRFCSRWGLPCRPRYRVRGALLPHLFTLTAGRGTRRFDLCGAFPGVAPAGRYPAPCFRGARTFLPREAGAAVRPTGAADVRPQARPVKPGPGVSCWRGWCGPWRNRRGWRRSCARPCGRSGTS